MDKTYQVKMGGRNQGKMKSIINLVEERIERLNKYRKIIDGQIEEHEGIIKGLVNESNEYWEELKELNSFLEISGKIELNSKYGKDAVAKGQMSLEDFRDIGSQSSDVNKLYPCPYMEEDVKMDGGKDG